MKELALAIGNYTVNPPDGISVGGIAQGQTVAQTLTALIFLVAILIALFSLVLGGINWVISEGKKENIERARNQIQFAIIGLVIVFLSFFIVNTVGNFFNVSLFGHP